MKPSHEATMPSLSLYDDSMPAAVVNSVPEDLASTVLELDRDERIKQQEGENETEKKKKTSTKKNCILIFIVLLMVGGGVAAALVILVPWENINSVKKNNVAQLSAVTGGDLVAESSPPSALPSQIPSSTLSPTLRPTSNPSLRQTFNPSLNPSFNPSLKPSLEPSLHPSMPPTERKTLSFFAIGDVPYSDLEACLLPYELDKAANSGEDAKFMLHLGDIRDGKPYESGRPRPCPEYMYEDVATIFESSSVPTFFMVGDNGWLDCADADESYTFWKKHLLTFHERTDLGWPELGATVKHSGNHAEFFAFVMKDVLIVGQGLPGRGQDRDHAWNDWDAYLTANVDWTQKAFAENNFKAVVVCGNSSKFNNERYFEGLEKIAKQYSDVPILFLGDEHDFQEEFEFRGLPNMHRIALDDVVTPTLITVDPYATGGAKNVFKYDRRCPCAGNHRPTELFSYSSGRCAGVCDTNKYCSNEDAESVLWGEA